MARIDKILNSIHRLGVYDLQSRGGDRRVIGHHARKLAILQRRDIPTLDKPAERFGSFDIAVDQSGQAE